MLFELINAAGQVLVGGHRSIGLQLITSYYIANNPDISGGNVSVRISDSQDNEVIIMEQDVAKEFMDSLRDLSSARRPWISL